MPICIAARGKSLICPHYCNEAQDGDHEFHCVNFTPSVNLIVDVKDTLDRSDVDEVLQIYYKGMHVQLLVLYTNIYNDNVCFAASSYVCLLRRCKCDLERFRFQAIVTDATRGGTHPGPKKRR